MRRPSVSQRRSVSTVTPSISAAWPTRILVGASACDSDIPRSIAGYGARCLEVSAPTSSNDAGAVRRETGVAIGLALAYDRGNVAISARTDDSCRISTSHVRQWNDYGAGCPPPDGLARVRPAAHEVSPVMTASNPPVQDRAPIELPHRVRLEILGAVLLGHLPGRPRPDDRRHRAAGRSSPSSTATTSTSGPSPRTC